MQFRANTPVIRVTGAVQDNQALGDVYHRLDVDVNDDAVLEPQHVQVCAGCNAVADAATDTSDCSCFGILLQYKPG